DKDIVHDRSAGRIEAGVDRGSADNEHGLALAEFDGIGGCAARYGQVAEDGAAHGAENSRAIHAQTIGAPAHRDGEVLGEERVPNERSVSPVPQRGCHGALYRVRFQLELIVVGAEISGDGAAHGRAENGKLVYAGGPRYGDGGADRARVDRDLVEA